MSDWVMSKTHPGYREKTIVRGVATIVILRPILDSAETKKREHHVQEVIGSALAAYFRRKEEEERYVC